MSLNGIDGKLGWFIFKIALTGFCLIIRIIEKFVNHEKPKSTVKSTCHPTGCFPQLSPLR